MMRKLVAGVVTSAVVVAVLSACGGTASTGSPAPAPAPAAAPGGHDDADTVFVQGMVPHHAQAVQMAKLAADRAGNADVKALATRIEQAQDPEIAQMRSLLAAWGMPGSGTGGMDHDTMPGMNGGSGIMSDDQLRQLESSTGAQFDRMFLQMMTEHHQGAIDMSRTEVTDGQNPDAKALAQRIIDAQQTEITEMQGLLTKV
jgi:uncharacterized protein (DUF305 family)